jgi:hypothetical protein
MDKMGGVIRNKKRRGSVHRMRWKEGQNRRIHYTGMGQNRIKEMKIE